MLEGYRVIELATHIAAPAAGGIMADWGADVIKVERPEGDPIRQLRIGPGGCSPIFETNNRGKRSLALDITELDGLLALLRLIRTADVFLTSLRPSVLERLGLDWNVLRRDDPQLVYASVTGYGLSGPDRNTPAYDNGAFRARSGMAYMTGAEGTEPFAIRGGVGDHCCSLATALGVVAALLDRTRTGRGRLVETSLLHTGIYIMGLDISNFLRTGQIAATPKRNAPRSALTNCYRSADGHWFHLASRDGEVDWKAICEVADCTTLIDDPRFSTIEARRANSSILTVELEIGFGRQNFDMLTATLVKADLIWAPRQSIEQVVTDRQALASGCFANIPDGAGGLFQAPASPVRFGDSNDEPKGRVPKLGEHTAEILSRIGN